MVKGFALSGAAKAHVSSKRLYLDVDVAEAEPAKYSQWHAKNLLTKARGYWEKKLAAGGLQGAELEAAVKAKLQEREAKVILGGF